MQHFENIYSTYTELSVTDIYPVQYGEEQCVSGHSFGPFVRNNYLLHYIYSGKGVFKAEGIEYNLHSGQMFLICPNQLTYYRADKNDPWLYRWIEFNGSMVKDILSKVGLNVKSPIYTDNADMSVGKSIYELVNLGNEKFENVMCKFWGFISSLEGDFIIDTSSTAEEYVKQAELFIKNNIYKKISIIDLSRHIGIDRSYLSRLFKQLRGTTIQEYIISLKMNNADMYLRKSGVTVSEAGQSVGYYDSRVFSKAFKRHFGVSPSERRSEKGDR